MPTIVAQIIVFFMFGLGCSLWLLVRVLFILPGKT